MFDDRSQAGQALGALVAKRVHQSPVVVLALPRGGVPVALEVAMRLEATVELDVFLVRKLGVPDHEELAFGAIASGGIRVLNRSVIEDMDISDAVVARVAKREQEELQRREELYRRGRDPVTLHDRTLILVDDGLATGASMIAAVRAARLQSPLSLVVAAPVASRSAITELRSVADEVICNQMPEPFYAVGYWYRDFEQVSDDEVCDALRRFTPAAAYASRTRQ